MCQTCRDSDKSNLFVDDSTYPAVCQCKQDIEDVRAEIKDHRREVRLALRMPAVDYVTVSGIEVMTITALILQETFCEKV